MIDIKKYNNPIFYYILVCILYIIFWMLIPVILISTNNNKGLDIFYVLLNGIVWLGIISGIFISVYYFWKNGKGQITQVLDQTLGSLKEQVQDTISASASNVLEGKITAPVASSAPAGSDLMTLAQQFLPFMSSPLPQQQPEQQQVSSPSSAPSPPPLDLNSNSSPQYEDEYESPLTSSSALSDENVNANANASANADEETAFAYPEQTLASTYSRSASFPAESEVEVPAIQRSSSII